MVEIPRTLIVSLIIFVGFAVIILSLLYLDILDLIKVAPEGVGDVIVQEEVIPAEKALGGLGGLLLGAGQAFLFAFIIYFILNKLPGDVQHRENISWDEFKQSVIVPKLVSDNNIVAVEGNKITYDKDSITFTKQRRYNKSEGDFLIAEVETVNGVSTIDLRRDLPKEDILSGDYTFEDNTPLSLYYRKESRIESDYPKFRITDPREKTLQALKEVTGREEFEDILRRQITQEGRDVKVTVEKEKEVNKASGEEKYVQTP